jgi:hypothetical protein
MASTLTVHLRTERTRAPEIPSRVPVTVPLHAAFANLRDTPEEVAAFAEHWGPPVVDEHGQLDVMETLIFRNMLRSAWRGEKSIDGSPLLSEIFTNMSDTGGRIEVAPQSLWQSAFLLFWHDRLRGKTGFCAAPGCPSPFFVKKHPKTQKFCSDDCAAYGRRQSRKKWRDAHGTERRKRAA